MLLFGADFLPGNTGCQVGIHPGWDSSTLQGIGKHIRCFLGKSERKPNTQMHTKGHVDINVKKLVLNIENMYNSKN